MKKRIDCTVAGWVTSWASWGLCCSLCCCQGPPPLSRFVDLDESDDDPEDFRSVVYDEGKESVIQEFFEERNITGEEATRLLGLLVDQQDKLYQKLQSLIEGPAIHVESQSLRLLGFLLNGAVEEAIGLVDTLLPNSDSSCNRKRGLQG